MVRKVPKKTWVLLATLVAALTVVGVAAASVTFDPTCSLTINGNGNGTGACGFVGKGDVQTALGYNNKQMQSSFESLAFTYRGSATQDLSQDGTEALTQSRTEVLECDTINGVVTFQRDGSRTGSRSGSRDGTREGTISGTVSYSIDYTSRQHNQYDGFLLTSVGSGSFDSGSPVWDAWVWDSASWGTTTWGNWVPASGDPASSNNTTIQACYDDGSHINSDVINNGAVTEGAITESAIDYGAITPTGSFTLYVNGVAIG